MSLTKYKQKRDFQRTPEPAGTTRRAVKTKSLRFVIQKHDATRLHYDLRLEWDGVLKSWAVPKGPSLDPSERRLAVEVEDHPIEYGKFEGTIPEGEYGGGTVLLWDRGTWSPDEDAAVGLREGKLKFHVAGEKLQGGYMLVRMPPRKPNEKPQWLLIKERDEHARPHDKYDVTVKAPKSVATDRTIEQIGKDAGRTKIPSAKATAKTKMPTKKKPAAKHTTVKKSALTTTAVKRARAKKSPARKSKSAAKGKSAGEIPGSRPAKLPRTVDVQLATLASPPPEGADWLYEIKFDGYRIVCVLDDGRVKHFARNRLDWTARFPELAQAVEELSANSAILDGEAVVQLPGGVTDFQALQAALSAGNTSQVVYYAFDLLYLDGYDLRGAPLVERKAALKSLLRGGPSRLQFSDDMAGSGADFLRQSCQLGLEGIIAKRRDGEYRAGRGHEWLKIKCSADDEFVIGGFTDPEGARQGIGSLLVGYYDDHKQLAYAGRVGTGFTEKSARDLRRTLAQLEQASPAFAHPPKAGGSRATHWVRPDLVAQVQYSNFTRDGLLRHPSFKGLREDKPATSVRRDTPIATLATDAVVEENNAMPRAKKAVAKPKAKVTVTKKATRKKETRLEAKPTKSPRLAPGGSKNAETEIAGVRVTHPDRVLYPDSGVTKRSLAEYYVTVADWILPHLADRPLSLLRCPGGAGAECFFQKHMGTTLPDWVRRVSIKESAGVGEYVIVEDTRGLVAMVQMSVLEIHPWGSQADDVDRPDRIIFDLDPGPDVSWKEVVSAARAVREALREFDLVSFVKTTGGKGLHVVAPITRKLGWDEVKPFTRGVAEQMVKAAPERFTANMSKATRKGKIFIDYLRNDRGATAVAAYSSRARATAGVSTPLDWSELGRVRSADEFTVLNVARRLKRLNDPWKDFFKTKQSITQGMLKQAQK